MVTRVIYDVAGLLLIPLSIFAFGVVARLKRQADQLMSRMEQELSEQSQAKEVPYSQEKEQ